MTHAHESRARGKVKQQQPSHFLFQMSTNVPHVLCINAVQEQRALTAFLDTHVNARRDSRATLKSAANRQRSERDALRTSIAPTMLLAVATANAVAERDSNRKELYVWMSMSAKKIQASVEMVQFAGMFQEAFHALAKRRWSEIRHQNHAKVSIIKEMFIHMN